MFGIGLWIFGALFLGSRVLFVGGGWGGRSGTSGGGTRPWPNSRSQSLRLWFMAFSMASLEMWRGELFAIVFLTRCFS